MLKYAHYNGEFPMNTCIYCLRYQLWISIAYMYCIHVYISYDMILMIGMLVHKSAHSNGEC